MQSIDDGQQEYINALALLTELEPVRPVFKPRTARSYLPPPDRFALPPPPEPRIRNVTHDYDDPESYYKTFKPGKKTPKEPEYGDLDVGVPNVHGIMPSIKPLIKTLGDFNRGLKNAVKTLVSLPDRLNQFQINNIKETLPRPLEYVHNQSWTDVTRNRNAGIYAGIGNTGVDKAMQEAERMRIEAREYGNAPDLFHGSMLGVADRFFTDKSITPQENYQLLVKELTDRMMSLAPVERSQAANDINAAFGGETLALVNAAARDNGRSVWESGDIASRRVFGKNWSESEYREANNALAALEIGIENLKRRLVRILLPITNALSIPLLNLENQFLELIAKGDIKGAFKLLGDSIKAGIKLLHLELSKIELNPEAAQNIINSLKKFAGELTKVVTEDVDFGPLTRKFQSGIQFMFQDIASWIDEQIKQIPVLGKVYDTLISQGYQNGLQYRTVPDNERDEQARAIVKATEKKKPLFFLSDKEREEWEAKPKYDFAKANEALSYYDPYTESDYRRTDTMLKEVGLSIDEGSQDKKYQLMQLMNSGLEYSAHLVDIEDPKERVLKMANLVNRRTADEELQVRLKVRAEMVGPNQFRLGVTQADVTSSGSDYPSAAMPGGGGR